MKTFLLFQKLSDLTNHLVFDNIITSKLYKVELVRAYVPSPYNALIWNIQVTLKLSLVLRSENKSFVTLVWRFKAREEKLKRFKKLFEHSKNWSKYYTTFTQVVYKLRHESLGYF